MVIRMEVIEVIKKESERIIAGMSKLKKGGAPKGQVIMIKMAPEIDNLEKDEFVLLHDKLLEHEIFIDIPQGCKGYYAVHDPNLSVKPPHSGRKQKK